MAIRVDLAAVTLLLGSLVPLAQADAAVSVPAPALRSTQVAQAVSTDQMVQTIHAKINQYRASKRLPPLSLDARISAQALAHSQAMANKQVPFSHQGFQTRVNAIKQAIPLLGAAENVAFNYNMPNPADQAVQGWIKSTGHRANIEGNYTTTGIGVARNAKGEYYYTQIFIRKR